MLKAYKYRIYPNSDQKTDMAKHFGCTRWVYNWALSEKKKHYEETKKNLSKRDLQDRFVQLKKQEETEWLKEVNSQALLSALLHLDIAFKNFFRCQNRFPRFKSRKSNWHNFQCPQHVKVDFENGRIQLPKIGWVKTKLHREFDGVVKTCTIKKAPSGEYQISVLVDTVEQLPEKMPVQASTTVGIDLGIKDFAIPSTGDKISNPRFLQQGLDKLNALQKRHARKEKGSHNCTKSRIAVAIQHQRITQQRNDFLHKQSSQLLSENQTVTIALEDLNIRGMVRNHKLARHISDVSWGRFVEFLKYKADWQGKNVIQCGRFDPSSKQCACGYKNKSLKLSDREWDCPECHAHHDRDLLASQNIKKFALMRYFEQFTDSAGYADCVKSSPLSKSVSAVDSARDKILDSSYGSQEAQSITALAV